MNPHTHTPHRSKPAQQQAKLAMTSAQDTDPSPSVTPNRAGCIYEPYLPDYCQYSTKILHDHQRQSRTHTDQFPEVPTIRSCECHSCHQHYFVPPRLKLEFRFVWRIRKIICASHKICNCFPTNASPRIQDGAIARQI